MSHHFDTAAAKKDPRLNICDMYVFPGTPGAVTMIMTVNADAGLSSPESFHAEGIYSFCVDTDGDAAADRVFKFRFRDSGQEGSRDQELEVIAADGGQPRLEGRSVLNGTVGSVLVGDGVKAFAGMVPELWAADVAAFQMQIQSLLRADVFDASIFERRENTFRNRNVMAIVLEIPETSLGSGEIAVWGIISLYGHAQEVQVYRYGIPLMTHLFLSVIGDDLVDRYHASTPSEDVMNFRGQIASLVSRYARDAGATDDPAAYGEQVAEALTPSVMRYVIAEPARFDSLVMNGRLLADDAYDVMWTRAMNRPVTDGVSPDKTRIAAVFPYYGAVYTAEEQRGLSPIVSSFSYEH